MFMTTIVGMSGSNERGSLRIFRRPPNTNVTGRIAAKGMACAALVGFALIGTVAQAAAVASLRPAAEKELLERVDATVRERARVLAALRATGWQVPDTEANFVWLPTGTDTDAFAAACETAGVVVRPFSGEGVRVTIGEPEANDLFLDVAARERA